MIYFIRHAESISNAGERTSDVAAIPLSDKGKKQAEAFAQAFNVQPDLIIMSPFIRTQQTAAPYLAKHSQIPTEIWNIQEFCCLDTDLCCNTNVEERRKLVTAYKERNDANYIDGKGAESLNQLMARVDDMFEKLKQIDNTKNVVVFTHGLFMRGIETRLLKLDITPYNFLDFEGMPNLTVLEYNPQNRKLTKMAIPGMAEITTAENVREV